ncbi:glycosyltransferase family 9 protein [Desulfovibrionales bacterium]
MRRSDFHDTECLTVRLSALGDALLTTGVLEYWRQHRRLEFHVLTRPALAPVFDGHPAVRQVIAVSEPDLHGLAWWRFCQRLHATHGFLPCIDLHATVRTQVLRALWHGRYVAYPKFSLTRRAFMQTRLACFSHTLLAHSVPQRYSLALESQAPPPEVVRPVLFLRPDELTTAQGILKAHDLCRPIALHPFATHQAKTLSPQAWQDMARHLQELGHTVIIVGRAPAPLFPGAPFDLTNATDLRTTAAILSLCRALISGDSGPMHLATAVGTPCIALFGPTTREWGFYPSGPQDMVLQASCPDAPCSLHGQYECQRGHACMTSISMQEIMDALHALPDAEQRIPAPLS